MTRFFCLSLTVLCIFAISIATYADSPIMSPNWTVNNIPAFVHDMSQVINSALDHGPFSNLIFSVLVASDIFLLLWTAVQYMRRKVELFDLITVGFLVTFVGAIYSSYEYITWFSFSFFDEAGKVLQQQLLGTSSVMGPVEYMEKFYASFYMEEVDFFEISLSLLFNSFFFWLFSQLMIFFGWLCTIWGVLGYLVVLPLGKMLIPTMLHKKTAFMFEGWLSIFLGFALYGFVARCIISVVCLLMARSLQLQYGTLPGEIIVVDAVNSMNILFISGLGVVFLGATGWIVGKLVQGAFQGVGAGLHGIASNTTRIAAQVAA